MSLQEKLDAFKKGMAKQAPKEALEIMHRATVNLQNSGIMEGVVKVGDTAPDFELQNAAGKLIGLKDILAEGPLVLCFYRGKW